MTKKIMKTLAVAMCAVLLVAGSIAGTMAYLTSTAAVSNTFTAGKVAITMTETDVDKYGVKDGDTRVIANEYKLIPGHTYIKDPTIYVDADSENCWLFVKVVNEISAVEASGETTIANQLTANGWTRVEGTTNIYWHDVVAANTEVKVFEKFVVDVDSDSDDIKPLDGKTVVVTAYAVQTSDNFANAKAAWNATFGAPQNGQ